MVLSRNLFLPLDDVDCVVYKISSSWESLRNKTLLITGGTGFFGKWLLETFIYANIKYQLNAHLVILSRDPKQFKKRFPLLVDNRFISFELGNVRDLNIVKRHFDFIIHAATDIAVANSSDYDNFVDITVGAKNIFDYARETSKPCKILLVSSGAVYGAHRNGIDLMTESCNTSSDKNVGNFAYAEGKRMAEFLGLLSAQENDKVSINIARCFAFVGPYLPLNGKFAIGNFILDAIEGRNIKIRGDGSPLRSYLYAADLSLWLWEILFNGRQNEIYNVGGNTAYSIAELAQITLRALSSDSHVVLVKTRDQAEPIKSYLPDVSKAEIELNLKPNTGLELAIKKTATWYQQRIVSMG